MSAAGRARRRRTHIDAVASHAHTVNGVAVVASYQTLPATDRPFKLNGRADTARTARSVTIALTAAEARKAVADWQSFAPSVFARAADDGAAA